EQLNLARDAAWQTVDSRLLGLCEQRIREILGVTPHLGHRVRSTAMSARVPRIAAGTYTAAPLRKPLGDWQAAVVRMSNLDPVTTEIIRMRCAVYHDCKT
ncbi:MAG: hypothetical protein EBU67_09465, partial [Actinobacteria bacterium]|nr:hypothetical protein [Actinomycetota bacterium]